MTSVTRCTNIHQITVMRVWRGILFLMFSFGIALLLKLDTKKVKDSYYTY